MSCPGLGQEECWNRAVALIRLFFKLNHFQASAVLIGLQSSTVISLLKSCNSFVPLPDLKVPQQKSSVLPPYLLLLFLHCRGDWLVAIVGTVHVREGVAAPESSCSAEVRVKSLICQCTDTLLKTALIKILRLYHI